MRAPGENLRVAKNPFAPSVGVGEAFAYATAGRSGVRWGGPRGVSASSFIRFS